jgi:hypothetical protein
MVFTFLVAILLHSPPVPDPCAFLKPTEAGLAALAGLPDPTGGFKDASSGRVVRAAERLAPWLQGVRQEARTSFGAATPDWKRAAAFLKRQVYARPPLLLVGVHAFRFVEPVYSLMPWLECRRGQWQAARRWLLEGDPFLRRPGTMGLLDRLRALEAPLTPR